MLLEYYMTLQLGEDELKESVVLVFANKQDLPNAMSVSQVQEALGLQEYRNRKVFHCFLSMNSNYSSTHYSGTFRAQQQQMELVYLKDWIGCQQNSQRQVDTPCLNP